MAPAPGTTRRSDAREGRCKNDHPLLAQRKRLTYGVSNENGADTEIDGCSVHVDSRAERQGEGADGTGNPQVFFPRSAG